MQDPVNEATTSAGARRAEFLSGLRVLELGDGIAGATTTSLLWALGADVTAVVDPAGAAHRRGRPRVEREGRPVSLLSIILDRGKQLTTIGDGADLDELLAHRDADGRGFDLVVVDRVGGTAGPLAAWSDIDRYAGLVERHNTRAWLTISAFGLTGARAADTATEITVAAASGLLASVHDQHTGQPLKLPGAQSLLNTGQAGALAACHALDLAAHEGPAHLDLAAVEATIAMGPTLALGDLLLETGNLAGAKRYGAPASFYECSDGRIRISAMEDHQWRGVVTAMGSPDWASQFDTVLARIDSADEIDARVAAWASTLTKAEAETLLQSHGVPATAVNSPAEFLRSPQLAHRAALEPLQVGDGRTAQVVGLPFRVVGGGAACTPGAGRRRRSLRGLRMLEAGRVLAVPLAGAVLGALGVEVTKLEDLPRLDMYRRRGPYIDGEAGMERSAYFALANHSKRSSAFDVDADRARLDALLGESDVIIENLGHKRASALGIAASTVGARHPDLLALSSSGFGQDGPHSAYRAYAYNLHASAGLGYLTRNAQDEPADIDVAWADVTAAFTLATIIAAWATGPSGNAGIGLDFAMADLITAHVNEFTAAASLDPGSDRSVDRANELAPYAPHGVYPTGDGWLAIAVDGDEQFAGLLAVLDDRSLRDPAFADADERFARRQDLDERLAAATRAHSAPELAAALRAAGIATEQVVTRAGLLQSAQLGSREFFTEVEHPEWGRRRLIGIPWRPYGEPPIALGAPPLLRPTGDRPLAGAAGRTVTTALGRD